MEYHNILAGEGEEAPIVKLVTLADNIADLASQSAASILSMQTPERASFSDSTLERIKKLEVRMASVESHLDKKE